MLIDKKMLVCAWVLWCYLSYPLVVIMCEFGNYTSFLSDRSHTESINALKRYVVGIKNPELKIKKLQQYHINIFFMTITMGNPSKNQIIFHRVCFKFCWAHKISLNPSLFFVLKCLCQSRKIRDHVFWVLVAFISY